MARLLGEAFVVIRPETKGFRAETETQVKRDLAGLDPNIKIGADVKDVGPQLAAMQAKLRAASKGRMAIADLIDFNLTPPQIVGQLILLKRLVQRSGISDLIDFNVPVSQIQQQLQKVSDLSATISVEADTSDAVAAVETLRLKLQALGSRLGALQVNADTADAQANVAKLQARLERIRDQVAKVVITGDTAKLDKQIASEEAKLATLQRKASGLQVDADTAKAAARIAGLEKQAADLYEKLDHLEADVDVNAALTKIYAVEAELAVLKSDAKAVEVHAQTAQFNSAIAASEALIADLKRQAADVRLGATFDTAGLAAARAAVSGLAVDVDKVTNSFASASVAIKKVDDAGTKTAKVPIMTRGWWGGGILGIKFWHLALDAALESAIAITGAAIAAAAGIAAISEPALNVAQRLQAVRVTSAALGVDIPPLTGKFDALMKSMVPQTIELFGAGLRIVNSQAGNLRQTFEPVVNLFDTWAAKIVIWIGNQHKLSQAVQGGLGYLSQFGTAIGHLIDAIDRFLTKDPGIAHYFVDLIVGFTGVLDLVSKLPGPLLATALGLHAVYLWTKVLAVAPILGMAKALGILSNAQVGAAKSALSFRNIMKFLAVNPLGWVADAAVAVGLLAYQFNTADAGARTFIGNLEQGLANLGGGDALFGISQAIGQLNSQIQGAFGQANLSKIESSYRGFSGRFKSNTLSMTAAGKDLFNAFGDLTSGKLGKSLSEYGNFFGQVFSPKRGAAVVEAANQVREYRDEISKLGRDQGNLVQVMGHFVGQGKSVEQSLALMNLAGVKFNDGVQVGIEKINNLIAGYKNITGTGGALENSVNAVTFAALQQQEKVSQLNQAWDTFFKTVTGGASGFLDFAKQTIGLYQSMDSSAAKLHVSNGKVSISLAGVAQAAGNTSVSMTGLNIASLNAQQTFLQSADAANQQMDNLNLLANAAGLSERGVSLLARANKDMVASLLPAAQHSKILTDVLYALAQRGGYKGADSLKALAKYAGVSKSPLKDLQGITTTLTTKASDLAQDVKNLSLALGTTLNNAMASVVFTFDKGKQALTDFAASLQHGYTNSKAQQSAALELGNTLLKLTGNTTDAHREFDTFARQLGLSRQDADKLWSEITGKLTPAINDQANKVLPAVKNAFASWSKDGLDLSHTAADKLWGELTGKLGPYLSNNLAQAVLSSKAKFEAWAGPGGGSGLGLTRAEAGKLYDELRTLQGFINSMHGKSISIHMNGQGLYTISGSVIAASQGKGGSGNAAGGLAEGGLIRLGSGPTADDVAAMLSRNEFVQPSKAVEYYGVGAMEAVRRRQAVIQYADGGLVGPVQRLAAGGSVRRGFAGGIPALDPMPGSFEADATRVMQAAQVAAMRTTLKAAEKAAIAAAIKTARATSAAYSGPGTLSARAIEGYWTSVGGPGGQIANIAQAITVPESGRRPGAVQAGQPYATTGWGLWQITPGNSEPQAGINQALLNPHNNAIAAVAKYRQAGNSFTPWTTYVNGLYRPYLLAAGGLVPGYAPGGLAGAESAEKSGYSRLVAAYRYDLAHARKGSWTYGHKAGITSELGTLGKRQAAEVAAYNAVIGRRGSLSRFATTVREESATSHDIDLSHSHPALSRALWSDFATLLRLANAPGGAGGGGSSGSHGGMPHDPGKAKLIAAQAGARAKYAGLVRSVQADLAHAKKGDYTSAHRKSIENELTTLRQRMNTENSAYARMAGSGFKPADWPKLASAAKAEMRTASDVALTHVHPLWARDLRKYLAEIADVKPPAIPLPPGSGGAGGKGGGSQKKISFAAYLAALKTDEARVIHDYKGLESAFAADLKHPKKGSWLYKNKFALGERLYRVAINEKAEEAAYNAILSHSGGTVADLTALPGLIGTMGGKAKAEAAGLQPSLLGHTPGGHPGWVKGLQGALNAIAALSVARLVQNPAWNPGNLGPVHTVAGGVLQFDTGRGVLPPGLSLTYNGTGRGEALSTNSARGGGDVHLHLTVNGPVGSRTELESWFTGMANKLARTGQLTQAVKVANR